MVLLRMRMASKKVISVRNVAKYLSTRYIRFLSYVKIYFVYKSFVVIFFHLYKNLLLTSCITNFCSHLLFFIRRVTKGRRISSVKNVTNHSLQCKIIIAIFVSVFLGAARSLRSATLFFKVHFDITVFVVVEQHFGTTRRDAIRASNHISVNFVGKPSSIE